MRVHNVPFSELPEHRPQYKNHVARDVREMTALLSLTRDPDVVVEDEMKRQTKALNVQAIAVRPPPLICRTPFVQVTR